MASASPSAPFFFYLFFDRLYMMYVCLYVDYMMYVEVQEYLPLLALPLRRREEGKKERRWKKLFAPQAELDLQYIAIALPLR